MNEAARDALIDQARAHIRDCLTNHGVPGPWSHQQCETARWVASHILDGFDQAAEEQWSLDRLRRDVELLLSLLVEETFPDDYPE